MKQLLSENTKVTISLGLLITVVVALFTGGIVLANYNNRLVVVEKVTHVHSWNNAEDIKEAVKKNSDAITQQQLDIIEMKTDLKWIRMTLEDRYTGD